MRQVPQLIIAITILMLSGISSCAQKNSNPDASLKKFAGSTPCDPLIRSSLGLSPSDSCDYIKWELQMGSDSYTLSALYGEEKPGTNGFMGGGTTLAIQGKYTKAGGSAANPRGKVYSLLADKNRGPFYLVEMDSNVLHFADSKKQLLIGNGGFGYMLNRLPN
jgi:hypothetical protein